MSLFMLKLVLTPLLIAAATLAARRWGPTVGGWVVSLPLTSGPVSVFLSLEHGPEFAATAAAGTIVGSLSVVAFIVAYAHAARYAAWPLAALAGLSGFFLSVAAMARFPLPPVPGAVFSCVVLALLLLLERRPVGPAIPIPAPRWDIPMRMAVATIVVLTITALSHHVGPTLSGLLSAFPSFICVMSIFSHKLCGADNVLQFERGIIIGSFAFVAFFFTVSWALFHFNLFVVYLLAILAAFGVNGCIMLFRAYAQRDA